MALKFELPENKKNNISLKNFNNILLFTIFIIVLIQLLISIIIFQNNKNYKTKLNPEKFEEITIKLENQGLMNTALENWHNYLNNYNIDNKKQSRIWYRIGKIYQELGNYEKALQAYYMSETLYDDKDIKMDINLRIQECLENSGKYSALRNELIERTSLSKNTNKGPVLAEIGPQKITKQDIDLIIEKEIDLQLSQLEGFISPDEIKKQKEKLYKEYSNPSKKREILEQYLIQEMLYRKAREDKLHEKQSIRQKIQDIEKKLLAQEALKNELINQIKISPIDLESFYNARKDEFVYPEKVKISHILLKDKSTALSILNRLNSGKTFEEMAIAKSLDKETARNGGKIDEWIEKGKPIPGIGYSEKIENIIFSLTPGQYSKEIIESEYGFHIIKVREKQLPKQKTFEEAKDDVYKKLLSLKQQEIQYKLFNQLKNKYNIVIHPNNFEN